MTVHILLVEDDAMLALAVGAGLRQNGWSVGTGGHIAVSCCVERAPDAQRVCLQVADDGLGVPVALRERIFERFYRVAGTGQAGSGIGLSLVSRIAQLHEAHVEAGQGIDGRGLAIRVCFPEWLDPAILVRA